MTDLLHNEPPDHREIGHELARRSGVDLTRARKGTVRLWEARGLALIALVDGDHEEVNRIMAPYRRKAGGTNGSR